MTKQSVYDFTLTMNDGSTLDTSSLKGKVVVVANTATGCGYAPQFKDLQYLYDTYKDKGLVVIGMPSDQFKQEAVSDDDMVGLCRDTFSVSFPLTKTVRVNGAEADPFITHIKQRSKGLLGASIKWNFTKFLIDQQGNVVQRLSPQKNPRELESSIVTLLEGARS